MQATPDTGATDDIAANADQRTDAQRAVDSISYDMRSIADMLPGLTGQPLVADWMVEAGFPQSGPADAARMIREQLRRIDSHLRDLGL